MYQIVDELGFLLKTVAQIQPIFKCRIVHSLNFEELSNFDPKQYLF